MLHTRSGALRASIHAAVASGDDAVAITLESTGVAYAAIQEYGGRTAAHDIVAVKAQALRLADGGFARSVHHPGSTIPARSYLRLGARGAARGTRGRRQGRGGRGAGRDVIATPLPDGG